MPTNYNEYRLRLLLPSVLFNLATIFLVIGVEGYNYRWSPLVALTDLFALFAVVLSMVRDGFDLWSRLDKWTWIRHQAVEWLTLAGLIFLVFTSPSASLVRWMVALRQGYFAFKLVLQTAAGHQIASHLSDYPARLIALSFASIIGVGTLMLTFPESTTDSYGASLLDALFTSVSATCVTGLTVQDTGAYFSRFGQVVILGLIQVGGLGIMTLSGAAAVLFGRRLGLRSRTVLADVLDLPDLDALQSLMVYIVKMTLLIEMIGAVLLFGRFIWDQPLADAAFSAVFHSVAAFCNAGFSTWGDSLTRYRGDWFINLVISLLIICGGLGFTVIAGLIGPELWRGPHASRWARLSVHVKMVVIATSLLLSLGMIIFYFCEYHTTLSQLPLSEKILGAAFSSVTARTAGFNTVDMGALSGAGVLLLVVLMFIGGAPSSTAGGIKVTTAGVLFLSVRAMLGGREEVECFGRTIPKTVVYKALAIAVISFIIVVVFFGLLLITERHSFHSLLFEAVSAFGTVGLSMDLTPNLTIIGKVLVIILMYIGRTGPLTMALAIGEGHGAAQYRLPSESVLVG
jgi:trk system potassium uptake protein